MAKKRRKKICPICKNKFTTNAHNQKYCSLKCKRAFSNRVYLREWRKQHPEKVIKSRQLQDEKYQEARRCACGNKLSKGRRKCNLCVYTSLYCQYCGKVYKVLRNSTQRAPSYFCSRECKDKFYSRKHINLMFNELQKLKKQYHLQNTNEKLIEALHTEVERLTDQNKELLKDNDILQLTMQKWREANNEVISI